MDSATHAIGRIKALARLVLATGLGLALLLAPPRETALFPLVAFVFPVYFLYAVVALVLRRHLASGAGQVAAVVGDAAALLVVLLIAPSHPAAFLLFFVYFTLVVGLWGGWRATGALSFLVSLVYFWAVWRGAQQESGASGLGLLPWESWAVVGGLLAAGTLVGTVAQRERRHIERGILVEHFSRLLHLDLRWAELWRRWLGELCGRYRAGHALLAYHDPETDRVLLWEYRRGAGEGLCEESDRAPRYARTFLLEPNPASLLGNGLDAEGAGQWLVRRENGRAPLGQPAEAPQRLARELSARALLSAPLEVGGAWRARLFLLDPAGSGFTPAHLDDLEELLAGLTPVLANLLAVRSLITQATDQERERISRDLHDGVAQTLASVEMQLNVFRRLATEDPAATSQELGHLQSVVKQEQEEFRRFLRTLKPVRVPATELNRWLLAHCAQFQQETGIEVDVMADAVDASVPEGVCREVFLIVREALHNVRKHAEAMHVLVKLRQGDAYLRLLVDDDGQGFPFSGTYSQLALEEKGCLPVSIAEHTRALGGSLTVDSTPGSGATVRVDIPLG